jgi:hypothetical protein
MPRVRFGAAALKEALSHLQHLCLAFFAQDERERRSAPQRDHTVQRAHVLLRARNTSPGSVNVSFSPDLAWHVSPDEAFQIEVTFTSRDLGVAFFPLARQHQSAPGLAAAHERHVDPAVGFEEDRAQSVASVAAEWAGRPLPWKDATPPAFASSWLANLAPSLACAYVLQVQLVTERHHVARLPAAVACPRPEWIRDSNALSTDRRWMFETPTHLAGATAAAKNDKADDLPGSFQRALLASLTTLRDERCLSHRSHVVSVGSHVLIGNLHLVHGIRVAGVALPPAPQPVVGERHYKRRLEASQYEVVVDAQEGLPSCDAERRAKQAKQHVEEAAPLSHARQCRIRDFFACVAP